MKHPQGKMASIPAYHWFQSTWQPRLDLAILGAAAMIGGHEGPESKFLECIYAYDRSGLIAKVDDLGLRAKEAVMRNPKVVEEAYASQRRAQNAKVSRSPFEAIESLLRSLPQPIQDEIKTVSAPRAPEFEATVKEFCDDYLWGTDIGLAAIFHLVGVAVHTEENGYFFDILNPLGNSREESFIQGLFYGEKRKPTTREIRKIVASVRKELARSNNHSRHQANKMADDAKMWAAIWLVYDGHPQKALNSGDNIFTSPRSKRLSQKSAPFNKAFGVQFLKGPEALPDTPLIRDRVSANRRSRRFRQ